MKIINITLIIFLSAHLFSQKAGSYIIQAVEPSNRSLTIDDSKNPEDNFAWIAPSNNSNAQVFTLEQADGEFFYIRCSNGLYMSIQSGHLTNESTLEVRPKENQDYFKWKFRKSGDGFVIESKAGSFIEISKPFGQNNAFVVTKQFMNGQVRQSWKLNPVAQLNYPFIIPQIIVAKKITETKTTVYVVSAQIGHMEHTIHNNDCNRLQGKIYIDIKNESNQCCDRIIKPRINKASILLDWSGDLRKDYKVRDIPDDQPMTDEPLFEVPKSLIENGSLFVKLTSDIKGCHKGGEGAWDYNCEIDYSGVFKYDLRQFKKRVEPEGGVYLEGELPIQAKKNGRVDDHKLTLFVTLYYNERK